LAKSERRLSDDCIAIVVSASGEHKAMRNGALVARRFIDVKLKYSMEVVSENRREDALGLV